MSPPALIGAIGLLTVWSAIIGMIGHAHGWVRGFEEGSYFKDFLYRERARDPAELKTDKARTGR